MPDLDPRARLIISQLAEVLRDFARRCDQLIGDSTPVHPSEILPIGRREVELADRIARGEVDAYDRPAGSGQRKRRQVRCGACGRVGYRRDGCGKSHVPLHQDRAAP